jgi:hypothetical protein
MTKNRCKQLQDLLRGQNFEAMQKHFVKHFVQAPDLHERCRPVSSEQGALVEGLLVAAVAHITGGDYPDRESLRIYSLPQLGLLLGDFFWQGVPGTFFFCEAMGVGLAYLPDHSGQPGYGRFRLRPLERAPIMAARGPFSAYPLTRGVSTRSGRA